MVHHTEICLWCGRHVKRTGSAISLYFNLTIYSLLKAKHISYHENIKQKNVFLIERLMWKGLMAFPF